MQGAQGWWVGGGGVNVAHKLLISLHGPAINTSLFQTSVFPCAWPHCIKHTNLLQQNCSKDVGIHMISIHMILVKEEYMQSTHISL